MDRLADSHAGQSSVRPLSDRAHVLLEINNAIVCHLDLAQVLNAISDCLRREIKHDFAGLALYDADSNHLRVPLWTFLSIRSSTRKGIRSLLLVPVLYAIFVMDLKILKWEEKGKQLHLETNEVATD